MVFLILCPAPFISNVIQTTLTVCIDGKYLLVSINARLLVWSYQLTRVFMVIL